MLPGSYSDPGSSVERHLVPPKVPGKCCLAVLNAHTRNLHFFVDSGRILWTK